MIAIPMQVSVSSVNLPVNLSADAMIHAMVGTSYQIIGGHHYEGSYEFTPSTAEQTISTANKVLDQDIVIQPIPQNYGLITYNGSYITVS